MYRFILIILILFTLNACTSSINENSSESISKNIIEKKQFFYIWNQIKSDPYNKLPLYKTSYFNLYKNGHSEILKDANRTLNSKKDLLPFFNKLAHPNGICLKGTWNISEKNKYSGYFKQNTKALIIARASSALSNTKNNQIRSLGFAGKIFPSKNEKEIFTQNTANFFLIDDLGGTSNKTYTSALLSNAPKTTLNYEVFKNIFYALEVKHAFEKVDKNANIRQVYEISELGEKNKIVTPTYMQIKAKKEINKNKIDFRNELKISNENLEFEIFVKNNKKEKFKYIGYMRFTESVTSQSCDHRLHFHHPKYK